MKKVCIITGGSSESGDARRFVWRKKGYKVYELSRKDAADEHCTASGIFHIKADVTSKKMISKAQLKKIIKTDGRIDVLINNAGFGISGAAEFTDAEIAQKQLNVNFFGAVRMCSAVISVMRNQHSGRIINIGSVAGVVPIPFQSFYSAAKAALLSYTLSLSNETKTFGISVVCIQPGDINTGFTASREKLFIGDEIYNGRISRSVAVMEHDEQNGMSAETAGKFIAKVAAGNSKKPVRTIGMGYKAACLLIKLLPFRLSNKIIGMIYAKIAHRLPKEKFFTTNYFRLHKDKSNLNIIYRAAEKCNV